MHEPIVSTIEVPNSKPDEERGEHRTDHRNDGNRRREE
jgi:hypothetical protein